MQPHKPEDRTDKTNKTGWRIFSASCYGRQGLYSLFGKEAIRHKARIDSPGQRQGKDGPGAGFAYGLRAFVQRRTGSEDIIHEEDAFLRKVLWPTDFKRFP
jgi:hypothetical protein